VEVLCNVHGLVRTRVCACMYVYAVICSSIFD
jgi:hypothetical protein